MPFLLTYPLVMTVVLALLFFTLLAKSFWKILLFVPLSVLAAFLLFLFSFGVCDLPDKCAGGGLANFFLGAPLFLINLSLMTLLAFMMAIVPPGRHGFLKRVFMRDGQGG